jgi:hypothetical protein
MISRLACLQTDGGKVRILRTSKFAFDHMARLTKKVRAAKYDKKLAINGAFEEPIRV